MLRGFITKILVNVRSGLGIIFLLNFLETIGWSAYAPSLPVLHARLGLTELHTGYIVSCTNCIGLLSALATGTLSDRYGRVSVLRISCFAQGFGSFLLIFFAAGHLTDYRLFVAIRVVCSGMKAGIFIMQAYIADVTKLSGREAEAVNHIALLMSAGSVAVVLGSILGGQIPFGYAFVLSACSFGAELLLLQRVPEPRYHPLVTSTSTSSPDRDADKPNKLSDTAGSAAAAAVLEEGEASIVAGEGTKASESPLSVSFILHLRVAFQIGNTIYESLQAMHLQTALQASTAQLGYLFGFVGLEAAVVNGIVVPALRERGGKSSRLMMFAAAGQAVSLCVWALAESFWVACCASFVLAVTSNTFLSFCSGMLGMAARSAQKGNTATSTGATYGLAIAYDRGCRALSPALGGVCFDAGYGVVAVTLPPLYAAVSLWYNDRRTGQQELVTGSKSW